MVFMLQEIRDLQMISLTENELNANCITPIAPSVVRPASCAKDSLVLKIVLRLRGVNVAFNVHLGMPFC